ncbi:MAG: LamG domain-containing protein [Candidatus Komeilibacteria bacterium]
MLKKITNNLLTSSIAALIVVGFLVGIGFAVGGGIVNPGTFTSGSSQKGLVGQWRLNEESKKVGAELLTNGDFTTDSDWGTHTGWTISGGKANYLFGGTNYLEQTLAITTGKSYQFSMDISNGTGSVNFILANQSGITLWESPSGYMTNVANGHYSFSFVASVDATSLRIYSTTVTAGHTGEVFSLDNVSLKELQTLDTTPNSNNGVIYGTSIRNHGYNFESSNNDYIEIPDNDSFTFTDVDFSVAAWVKFDSIDDSTETIIAGKADYGNNQREWGFGLTRPTSSLCESSTGGGFSLWTTNVLTANWIGVCNTTAPTLGDWYYVVATISGGTGKVYVNGALVKQRSSMHTTMLNGSANLTIGGVMSGGSPMQNTNGNIADVRIFDSALTGDQVLDLYNGSDVSMPVGWWSLDKGVKDNSGNGNDGVVTGASLIGEAAYFDGASDYVISTTAPAIDNTDGTLSFWMNPTVDDVADYHMIFHDRFGISGSEGWWISLRSDGRLNIGVPTGSYVPQYTTGNDYITLNEWQHIMLVFTGGGIDLYRNGVYTNNYATNGVNFDPYLKMGGNSTFDRWYNGYLRDVRIYDRALDNGGVSIGEIAEGEIASLYNNGSQSEQFISVGSDQKGLVGYWKLEQSSEKVSDDIVSNGGFDADSSWNTPGTINITGGRANIVQSGGLYLSQNVLGVTGKRYRLQYDVVAYNSGVLTIFAGGGNSISSSIPTAGTTYSKDFTWGGVDSILYFGSGSANDISIDNVILKELLTKDSTSASSNGALYQDTNIYTTDRQGQANKAMEFNGTSDYVDLGSLGSLGDEFTYSVWFKTTSAGSYNMFINVDGELAGNPQLRTSSGKVQFRTYGGETAQTGSTYNDGNWHLATGVHSNDTLSVYIDGQFANSVAVVTPINWTGNTRISKYSYSTDYYYSGSLSDVRIYNRALSLKDIQELYSSYNTELRTGNLNKGLIGSWDLDLKSSKTEGTVNYSAAGGNTVTMGDDPIYIGCSSKWGACAYGPDDVWAMSHVETTGPFGNRITVGNLTKSGTGGDYRMNNDSGANTCGRTFTFSMWAKNNGGSDTSFSMKMATNGDSNPSSSYGKTLTSEWQRFSITHTFSGTCTNEVRTYIFGTDNGSDIYLYGGQVEEKDHVTPFVNGTRLSKVVDSTPYSNHGDVYGATIGEDYSTFNGSNNYIMLPADILTDIFTISLWVNFDDTSNNRFFGVESGSILDDLVMQIYNGNFQIYNDSAYTLTIANPFTPGDWYNLVIDTNGNCYINNTIVASGLDISKTTSNLGVGVDGIDLGEVGYFDGNMSGIKIYNRVLSPTEVSSLYNKGR